MVHGCVRDRGQLEQRIFWVGLQPCNHCVFVQLCLRKTHLFSGVKGSIQSVTTTKRGRAGGRPAPTILNFWYMMAKQSLVSPTNLVLLQVLKTIWHRMTICKSFKLCFDIINYSEDTDNSIAHKLAVMTQLTSAILSSSSFKLTQCWRSFFSLQSFWFKVFWSYFFFVRVEKSSIFITPMVLMLPQHYAQALHITRYNYLCQFSHPRF